MAAVAGVLTAMLTGCSAGSTAGSVVDIAQLGSPQEAPSGLTVNPQDGASGVSPSEKVTAAVAGGQLTLVQLATAEGAPLAGALSADGERWASSQPLKSDTSYVLKATARSTSGQETTTTSRFSTLAPTQRVTGKIAPGQDDPVSANEPVSVLFDKAIGDRPAVERALRVTANPAVSGTAGWLSDRELIWRPTPAWPSGSQVTVTLDIFGKQLGNGLVGASDLRTTFAVTNYGSAAAALRSSSSGALSSPAPQSSAAYGTPSSAARPSGASRSALPSASARSSSTPATP